MLSVLREHGATSEPSHAHGVPRACHPAPEEASPPSGLRLQKMSEDTVLQEVRAAREAFARSHGFNVRAMVAALRALDDAGDWLVVRLAPRRPDVVVASMVG